MTDLNKTIASTIRSVIGAAGTEGIPLHEPLFEGAELELVSECVNTGWVSSVGKFVDQFEADLAQYCGVSGAVATSSGTAALHAALLLVGVRAGDEVILPSLTFVATANAVCHAGGVPHFADSEEDSLGIDPEKLAVYLDSIAEVRNSACYNRGTGARISALVIMHVFGHPAKMEQLLALAEKWSLPIVEDAAEALGSQYEGAQAGSFGRIGVLSFNGNKIITTGGGGALLANDAELARKAKHLTSTAKVPHRWRFFHDEVAYNYRMPNLNAALGVAQMRKLPEFISRKRRLADAYKEAFDKVEGVRFLAEPEGTRSNYWLCTLLLDRGYENCLEPALELTNELGLMTRPAWDPMHSLPMFTNCPRMNMDTVESLSKRLLSIPSGPRLAPSR